MKTTESAIIAIALLVVAYYMVKKVQDSQSPIQQPIPGNTRVVSISGDGCKNPPPIVMPGGWCCFSLPTHVQGPWIPITVEQP